MRSSEWSCAFDVLGSVCGACFGRQAVWRLVKHSGWCHLDFGGAVIAVAVSVIAWSLGSGCGLLLGRQAAWRPRCKWVGVVKLVGGTVLAVAVLRLRGLGLWLWAQTRSSSCLAAEVQMGWCRQIGWRDCVGSCCIAIAGAWALVVGSNSVVKLLGGRGCDWDSVVRAGW